MGYSWRYDIITGASPDDNNFMFGLAFETC